jgi:hypothetical protein
VVSQKLKAMKIDLNSNIVWGNHSLSTVSSNKYDVAVGDFRNDELVATWEDERMDMGVYSQNISGEGDLGMIATAVAPATSSSLAVYSTLAHDYFTVEMKENISATLQLMDISGKQMESVKLEKGINEIDLTALSAGIYFYHMANGAMQWSGMICVEK